MPDNATTVIVAVRQYLETLPDAERLSSQTELQRFARWCGGDRDLGQLRGQEIANYAETLSGGIANASQRADMVRRFLVFAKKRGYTATNLSAHLRLRKSTSALPARRTALKEVHLTTEQKGALEVELDSLKAQRVRTREDIKRAMADKDFRENAPLDAARQQQSYTEGRIRALELTLDRALIDQAPQASSSDGGVSVGSTVIVRNLRSGAEMTYTLVQPADVKAAQGRISIESPVGKALHQRRAGDEVEVAAPSGALRLRIERIEN